MIKKLLFLVALLFILSGVALADHVIPLEQDGGGTWQLDSVPNENIQYVHLAVLRTWSPKEGVVNVNGNVDSIDCIHDLKKKIQFARNKANKIVELAKRVYDRKYAISVQVYVCHPDWVVIYVHDFNDFVSKAELIKLQEALRKEK